MLTLRAYIEYHSMPRVDCYVDRRFLCRLLIQTCLASIFLFSVDHFMLTADSHVMTVDFHMLTIDFNMLSIDFFIVR